SFCGDPRAGGRMVFCPNLRAHALTAPGLSRTCALRKPDLYDRAGQLLPAEYPVAPLTKGGGGNRLRAGFARFSLANPFRQTVFTEAANGVIICRAGFARRENFCNQSGFFCAFVVGADLLMGKVYEANA